MILLIFIFAFGSLVLFTYLVTRGGRGIQSLSPGCGGCLGVVLFFLIIPLIWVQISPYLRPARHVAVTVLDEARKPVAGATIAISEYELVLAIPLLTFCSPSRSITREHTVETGDNGKANFTFKYERTGISAVTKNGEKLNVVSSETTDSIRGSERPQRVSHYLPQWNTLGDNGTRSYACTIVVTTL